MRGFSAEQAATEAAAGATPHPSLRDTFSRMGRRI